MKHIVITGCTKGLGLSMWREFTRLGHRVSGCGRSKFPEVISPPSTYSSVDVSRDDEVSTWARTILQDGAPDLLVNNAATINAPNPLWEISARDFQQLIDINIAGTTNTIRHFVPAMIEAGKGVVVNFSSGWGRSTAAGVAPYCATKWAIEGLSQALADDLQGCGVASVALNPGIIHTEMLETVWGQEAAQFIDPESWGKKAVPYLLSLHESNNGESLTV